MSQNPSIVVTSINFQSFSVVDSTSGIYHTGGNAVTAATVDVYVRNSATPITLNVLSYYVAVTTNVPVSYSITPAMLNQTGTIFTDGIYQLVFHITTPSPTTNDYTNFQLCYGNVLSGIQTQIGAFADILYNNCSCTDIKAKKTSISSMYMLLQSAIFSFSSSKLIQAQDKIDTIANYLANTSCETTCKCGCN